MQAPEPNLAAFRFCQEPFDALLASLGWPERERWVQHWLERGGEQLAAAAWRRPPARDWIWGLALPLLSQIENLAQSSQPILLGLSAIPATGKTTLCRWLTAAAEQLGIGMDAISIDDFYRASPDLEASMQGNPWGVSRGLPGSHDTALLLACLADWRQGRRVRVPIFDKTLRDGRGDRAGHRELRGSLLVLDGWFLGVPARPADPTQPPDADAAGRQTAALSAAERRYRPTVLERLQAYEPIWQQIDQLWRIRPIDMGATASWKQQQTSFTLPPAQADQFIRMILCSLPPSHWQRIPCAVEAVIDETRTLHRIGLVSAPG